MLKQVLDNLTVGQRSQLMIAFEAESDQVLYLPNDKFIAVWLRVVPESFRIIEKHGAWTYGEVINVNT